MTDSPYPRRGSKGRMEPLPDKMMGSLIYGTGPHGSRVVIGRNVLRPNEPAPPREPPTDKRPVKLLEAAGFESAEEWGNSVLSERNGHGK